ncbi:hypothetical protein A7K93_01165 [Candidatus Methylacidiphilum fumarolicum]|nr:hypothetical protein A7K72_08885 [Candidatus Methylacidiphilum fumarolicum]TFE75460.1 hypothetical protein A7K93_01165 [Candidatus Methylacidiphilum fumarolicum]
MWRFFLFSSKLPFLDCSPRRLFQPYRLFLLPSGLFFCIGPSRKEGLGKQRRIKNRSLNIFSCGREGLAHS